IYGGVVISLARSLTFNGLANAFQVAGINGGRHVAPLFAGGTGLAWSQGLARAGLPGRTHRGAMRRGAGATRGETRADFPDTTSKEYDPAVILDQGYWVLRPR